MLSRYGRFHTWVLTLRNVTSAIFAISLLSMPGISLGQIADSSAGQAAFRVAVQAFRANQFDVAARSFEQAYELDPRPETAFSIAQANRRQYYYDKMPWRLQRALQLYQIYLEKLPKGPRANDAIDRIGELEPLLRELKQRGELVAFKPPVKTELVIGAEVEQATVTIDGQPASLWEPVSVSPGPHEVRLEAAGYETELRRVVITEGRFLPVDVELRAKPGRLSVRTEPDSVLYIDGRRVGSLPRSDTQIVAGSHFVSVTRRGRESFSAEIAVGRDQRLVLDAPLQVTTQRRASKWVFAGATTIAAASAGVALWGYSAKRDARALDEKRKALTATPAELRSYNQRVADATSRDRLAVGLGISAVAIGAVGLGLYWFDQSPPGSAAKTVSPILGSDTIGVSVGGKL
jgi:tetratricopeptide (TPR) repeat protein